MRIICLLIEWYYMWFLNIFCGDFGLVVVGGRDLSFLWLDCGIVI